MYRENWDNVQVAFFNPGVVGNIFYNTNGQNFLIKGIETSLHRPGHFRADPAGSGGLEPQRADELAGADQQQPGQRRLRSADHGRTAMRSAATASREIRTNPFGPIGSPSANAPPIQFSLRARYEWDVGGYLPFVQVERYAQRSLLHAGGCESRRSPPEGPITTGRLRFENPAYTTYDASMGVAKDAWSVQRSTGENCQQFERQHLRQHRSVHRRGDAPAAAGHSACRLAISF